MLQPIKTFFLAMLHVSCDHLLQHDPEGEEITFNIFFPVPFIVEGGVG